MSSIFSAMAATWGGMRERSSDISWEVTFSAYPTYIHNSNKLSPMSYKRVRGS